MLLAGTTKKVGGRLDTASRNPTTANLNIDSGHLYMDFFPSKIHRRRTFLRRTFYVLTQLIPFLGLFTFNIAIYFVGSLKNGFLTAVTS